MTYSKHEQLSLGILDLDAPFQREVVVAHPIAKAGYKEDLENEIVVVIVDGTHYVVDGKQRVTQKINARASGERVSGTIPAVVFYDATMQDAASLFMEVNRGRKALTPWDMFVARRAMGDPAACAVDRIAKSLGVPPAPSGNTDRLTAVGAALEVVEKHGPDKLERTLKIILDLYPGLSPYGRLINAIAEVLSTTKEPYRGLLSRGGDEYLTRRLRAKAGRTRHNLFAYITAKVSASAQDADNTHATWVAGIYSILGKRYYSE